MRGLPLLEKVTLCVGFLYLTSGSETDEGVAKDTVFARTGNQTRDPGSKPNKLYTRLSLTLTADPVLFNGSPRLVKAIEARIHVRSPT